MRKVLLRLFERVEGIFLGNSEVGGEILQVCTCDVDRKSLKKCDLHFV